MKEKEYLAELNKILDEFEGDLIEKDFKTAVHKAFARIKDLSYRSFKDGTWQTTTGEVIDHLRHILAILVGYAK